MLLPFTKLYGKSGEELILGNVPIGVQFTIKTLLLNISLPISL